MKKTPLLQQYQNERDQLLRTIQEFLENDPQVRAAWLAGSLGRGEADALSDIDLWVSVDDAAMEKIVAQPLQYISQIAQPVLFVEAPQNAPPGGAYLMAAYDMPVAPHLVDWYWQPQTLVHHTGNERMLFERFRIAISGQLVHTYSQTVDQSYAERPLYFVSFFWMMLIISGKYIARYPYQEEMPFLDHLLQPFQKAQRFLGREELSPFKGLSAHRHPKDKIQILRLLADQMRELMDIIAGLSEEVPDQIVPGAYRYLDLIEGEIE